MWDWGNPLTIDSVDQETAFFKRKRCDCGGMYLVGTQSHEWDEQKGRHLVVDHAQCSNCGRARKFAFDVSGYFAVNE